MALLHISGPTVLAIFRNVAYVGLERVISAAIPFPVSKKDSSTILLVSVQLPKLFEPNAPQLSRQVADSGPFSKFNLKLLEKISQKLPRNHTAAFQHDPVKDSQET